MKFNRIKAFVKKDLQELFSSKAVTISLLIFPFVICVILPIIISNIGFQIKDDILTKLGVIKTAVLSLYPIPAKFTALNEQTLYIFLNYTFLPMFLLLPLTSASIFAANCIVGEKERKTLETVLYSPITNKEFMAAKFFCIMLVATVISIAGFLVYLLICNLLSLIYIKTTIISFLLWLPVILFPAPAISAFGLSLTMIISTRAKSYMEAEQITMFINIPIMLGIIGLISLGVIIKMYIMYIIAGILLVTSYLIITKITPKFKRENIISTHERNYSSTKK